jgi:hypothetical protein
VDLVLSGRYYDNGERAADELRVSAGSRSGGRLWLLGGLAEGEEDSYLVESVPAGAARLLAERRAGVVLYRFALPIHQAGLTVRDPVSDSATSGAGTN